MGEAYKCDRCGNLFGGESPNGLKVWNRSKHNVKSNSSSVYIPKRDMELCPKCSEGLDDWIEQGRQ